MELVDWFDVQRELQVNHFGADPVALEGEALASYLRWNALALTDELHELLNEVQWKPWAENQGVILSEERALNEFVDILHFLANIGLALKLDPFDIAAAYLAKVEVNKQRQEGGYDTINVDRKCPNCKRDLKEAGVSTFKIELDGVQLISTQCDACYHELERKEVYGADQA